MTSPSPRRSESPLLRRKRDVAVAHQQCVQVQWRFLQHQNPAPPTFAAAATPCGQAPHTPAYRADAPATSSETSVRDVHSPTTLFDRFANPLAEAELAAEHVQQQRQQQQQTLLPPEHQQCRVLNDILGETQRKAMLHRIMADMEALALQTHTAVAAATAPLQQPPPQQQRPSRSNTDSANDRHAPLLLPSATKSSGMRTLRANLQLASPRARDAATRSSDATVQLLPQRRMSTLGAVALEEAASTRDQSNSNSEEDDDDSDNSNSSSDSAGNSNKTPHKRSSEAIAIAEIRKLHQQQQRQLARRRARGEEPVTLASDHIVWQKTSRVRLALDIPHALQIPARLTDASARAMRQPPAASSRAVSITSVAVSSSPNASHRDVLKASTATTTTAMDEQQTLDNLVLRRHRPLLLPTEATMPVERATTSPRKLDSVRCSSTATSTALVTLSPVLSPRDVRKVRASYGAWYVPRQQWWGLHQKEQQVLAEQFPDEARALAHVSQQQHSNHCHHMPHVRDHKPAVERLALPLAAEAVSPRALTTSVGSTVAASRCSSSRPASKNAPLSPY